MASASRQRASLATLFGKRLTRSPSLDDLAVETTETRGVDEAEEEGHGEEDDERQRLRRARARASARVGVAGVHGHKESEDRRPSDVSHGAERHCLDTDDEDEPGCYGEDDNGRDDDTVSADVKQLQQQVETLLQVRVEVDAWRYENQRLRERLAQAERQVETLQGQLDDALARRSPPPGRVEMECPSQRERELLRLLIHIVGRAQTRALVSQQQSPSGVRSPAELRRQLLARASKAKPGAGSPPRERKPTCRPLATRKHEMSDAM